MRFIQARHQRNGHHGEVQRHGFLVEQPQADEIIDRGIGVNQQRALLFFRRKTQLEANHPAGHFPYMLPGFGGAKIVAAGQLPLRKLEEVFAHEGSLPLTGVDKAFDNQLAHRLLDGHPAGAELRR